MKKAFKYLILTLLISGAFAQSFRVPLIYMWYYANVEGITDEHCVNKDIPMTTCFGQCYIEEIIDDTSGQTEGSKLPLSMKEFKENTFFQTLLSVDFNPLKIEKSNDWIGCTCTYSYTVTFDIFHPPQA